MARGRESGGAARKGDAIYAANGVARQINEARTAMRAEQLAREKIGEAQIERLKAEGIALGGDDIATLTFSLKDA